MQLNPDDAAKLASELLDLRSDLGADDDGPESGLVGVPGAGAAAIPGGRLGNYRITRLVGSGGMGEVYEAEQDNPRRRVALKVVRGQLLSKELRRRFEHEVRILGSLQHPGIAQIYEAGQFTSPSIANGVESGAETAPSTPYFAMEYVEGEPLTSYAASHKLGVRERLELFLRVCQAVEHAHQRGVIHRDLKPGNILVSAPAAADSKSNSTLTDHLGQPKVLDFGVARATDLDLTVTSLHTEIGKLVGTLPYMSPEQAAGDPNDLDTRSDVYALGVVLYELLSGKLPYEVKGDGNARVAQALRVIKEVDPTPLSSIDRVFRGDLETIVGKALEKERERRYQSVGELAGDVRRFLDDEPIVARKAGAWYEIRKFATRNRAAMVASGAVMIMVVGISVASVAFGLREKAARTLANQEQQRAVREMKTATAIREYLEEILISVDPGLPLPQDVTLREMLDSSSETILDSLGDQPVARAAVEATVGEAYRRIEANELAEEHLLHALDEQRKLLGDRHPDTCSTRHNYCLLLWQKGQHRQAIDQIKGVVADRTEVLGPDDAQTLNSRHVLANFLEESGQLSAAEAEYRDVLEKRERLLGQEDKATLTTMYRLGGLLRNRGQNIEAERLLRRAFETSQRVLGETHPRTLDIGESLARLLRDTGQLDEAAKILEANVTAREEKYGPDKALTLIAVSNLGLCRLAQGDAKKATELLRRVAEGRERIFGARHLSTAAAFSNLGVALIKLADLSGAEEAYRKAEMTQRELLPPGHPNLLSTMNSIADLLRMQGKNDDAIAMCEDVQARCEGNESVKPGLRARFAGIYGRCLTAAGKYEEAEPRLLEVYHYFLKVAEEPMAVPTATRDLATLYRAWGKPDEAAKWEARQRAAESAIRNSR